MNKHKRRLARSRRRNRAVGSGPPAQPLAVAPGPPTSTGREPPPGDESRGNLKATPGGGPGVMPGSTVDPSDRPDSMAGDAAKMGGTPIAGAGMGTCAGARAGAGGVATGLAAPQGRATGENPESRRGPQEKFSVELMLRVARRVQGGQPAGEAIQAEGMSRAQFYARVAREPKLSEWMQWTLLARPLEALEEELLQRAVYGVPRPIFRGGEQVGEWRARSDSLLIWMLEQYVPEKYGPRDEDGQPPPPLDMPDPLAVARAKVIGDMVVEEAFRRALDGVERPVFQRGELVGTVLSPSDRLLKYLFTAERRTVLEAARRPSDERTGHPPAVGPAEGQTERPPLTDRSGTPQPAAAGVGRKNGDAATASAPTVSPTPAMREDRPNPGDHSDRAVGTVAATARASDPTPAAEIPDNVPGFSSHPTQAEVDTSVQEPAPAQEVPCPTDASSPAPPAPGSSIRPR